MLNITGWQDQCTVNFVLSQKPVLKALLQETLEMLILYYSMKQIVSGEGFWLQVIDASGEVEGEEWFECGEDPILHKVGAIRWANGFLANQPLLTFMHFSKKGKGEHEGGSHVKV